MMNNKITKDSSFGNGTFIIFLVIISCLYFFFVEKYCINYYLRNYAISDLLIHYKGEFVRRGLLGTILLNLSDLFQISLKNTIRYFFYFFYVSYFTIYFIFLKSLVQKNKILLLFIVFSPLGILYPLYELESLLRKEIFLYIFFLSFLIILEKNLNEKVYYIYLSIVIPFLILIHDGFVFFTMIFFLAWSIKKTSNNSSLGLKSLIISSLTSIIVIYLHLKYIYLGNSEGYIDQIINNLSNYDYNIEKFAAFIWLERNLEDSLLINYENLNFSHFGRFLILLTLTFSPFIYFFKKINIVKKETKIIFFLTIISFSFIFVIALDWGRFLSIIFNLLIFLFVFSIKIFNKFYDLKFKRPIAVFLFLFIYCFTWNPKTTFLEKINFLPQKDVIERIMHY